VTADRLVDVNERAPAASNDRDPRAVSELFRENHLELVRLAVLIVGDQQTAEDVVQDVFTRVHARWDKITAGGDVLPYVRASVLNGCRSALRRRAVARRFGLGAAREPDPVWSAESAAIVAEDRREVVGALARLPARQREALILRYFLDLPVAEIAKTMGISEGTVKSTTSRGLAALARLLGERR
jgi:RNA polymerase sigma-70 factor (sigma-E family)